MLGGIGGRVEEQKANHNQRDESVHFSRLVTRGVSEQTHKALEANDTITGIFLLQGICKSHSRYTGIRDDDRSPSVSTTPNVSQNAV